MLMKLNFELSGRAYLFDVVFSFQLRHFILIF